jgi:hypothetical protein
MPLPRHAWSVSTLVAATALLAACVPAPAAFDALHGECKAVFGSEVCSWGVRADTGITEFGVTMPVASVEQAPMDGPMVFPPVANAILALPAEVAATTGFKYVAVGWELHGHPPALFLTPHFDFHFYTTTPEAAAAMDCTNLVKPAAMPAGYALPDVDIPGMGTLVGLCVPQMGMHAIAANEIEQREPFGASMIVGYYGGDLIFLEPMISKVKLMESATFEMPVPSVPPNTPASVRWPKTFTAQYNADTRAYRLAFGM